MFCRLLLGGILFLFIELPFDHQLAFFGVHIQLSAAGFFHFGSFYRPDDRCHYDHCNSQYLGSSQRGVWNHQAVGAQSLDDSTACTIPHHINQNQFAVKFAAFGVPCNE